MPDFPSNNGMNSPLDGEAIEVLMAYCREMGFDDPADLLKAHTETLVAFYAPRFHYNRALYHLIVAIEASQVADDRFPTFSVSEEFGDEVLAVYQKLIQLAPHLVSAESFGLVDYYNKIESDEEMVRNTEAILKSIIEGSKKKKLENDEDEMV